MAKALPAISLSHSTFTFGKCGIGRPAGRLPIVRKAAEPSAQDGTSPGSSLHPQPRSGPRACRAVASGIAAPLSQDNHQEHRAEADRHGTMVDRPATTHGEPQAMQEVLMAVAPFHQPEQVANLAQCNQEAGSSHEANHDGLGNVPRQVAQFENGNQNLNRADHHCERKGRLVNVPCANQNQERPAR